MNPDAREPSPAGEEYRDPSMAELNPLGGQADDPMMSGNDAHHHGHGAGPTHGHHDHQPVLSTATTVADPPGLPPTVTTHRGKPSGVRSLVEWIVVIVGALVVALVIRTFLLGAFYIPSESMDPTLKVGDRVLVNKLSYKLHDVNRGDVVVFKRPPQEQVAGIKDLIKRVIGLPGETIESRSGKVYINGRPLNEGYLQPGVLTDNLPPTKIPANEVFVMGDNRDNSSDSRVFGPIEENLIVGRAFVRVWPLTHLGWL